MNFEHIRVTCADEEDHAIRVDDIQALSTLDDGAYTVIRLTSGKDVVIQMELDEVLTQMDEAAWTPSALALVARLMDFAPHTVLDACFADYPTLLRRAAGLALSARTDDTGRMEGPVAKWERMAIEHTKELP